MGNENKRKQQARDMKDIRGHKGTLVTQDKMMCMACYSRWYDGWFLRHNIGHNLAMQFFTRMVVPPIIC